MWDIRTNRDLTPVTMLRLAGSRLAFASLNLQPGYYDLSVGRLPCTASRRLVVLRGADRSVVFKGQDVFHLHEGLVGVAGSLPSPDLVVTASCVYRGATDDYTAEVDGHAFYFDAIQGPSLCHINTAARNRPSDVHSSIAVLSIDNREHAYVIYNLEWRDCYEPCKILDITARNDQQRV